MTSWFLAKRSADGALLLADWGEGLGGSFRTFAERFPKVTECDPALDEIVIPDRGIALLEVEAEEEVAFLTEIRSVHRAQVAISPARCLAVTSWDKTMNADFAVADGEVTLDPLLHQGKQPSRYIGIVRLPGPQTQPCWINDGGYEGYLAERRQRAVETTQARVRAQRKHRHDDAESFINPYTFVPLPADVHRGVPRTHSMADQDGLVGWFDWELTFQTPLLLPQDLIHQDGTILRYPGSSLRGALRSVHEVLAGGCMRVLDEDYVPVHRNAMNAYVDSQYKLAVVDAVSNGRVTRLRMCDKTVWVPATVVHTVIPAGSLVSGSKLDVNDSLAAPRNNRSEMANPLGVASGAGWVAHLTASQARLKNHRYFVATGRLTGTYKDLAPQIWERFKRACEGSSDTIGIPAPPDTSGTSPGAAGWPGRLVDYGGNLVGTRRRVDSWLGVGDTVWVRFQGSVVNELKMAVIWRSEGTSPVSERMPATHLPCTTPDQLCPTCAVFGSVDTSENAAKEQNSFASHIRVESGKTVGPVTAAPRSLPPLRNPNPSSGGFYLLHPSNISDAQRAPSTDESHITRSHWGSGLDPRNKPRPIRGRKFYWHGQEPDSLQSPGRHQPRHQTEAQLGTATELPTGTKLVARISFDNLDEAQLGMLLAAANPQPLLDRLPADPLLPQGVTFAHHLGRGKPLGFGTAETSIKNLHVESARARYCQDSEPLTITQESAHDAAWAAANHELMDVIWRALRRVLTVGAVDADRIWYPTTGRFTQRNAAFDESFRFFQRNSGGRSGYLAVLPDVLADDLYLRSGEQDA